MGDWTAYNGDTGRAAWEYSLAGISGSLQAAFVDHDLWTYNNNVTNNLKVYGYAGNGTIETSDWYNTSSPVATVPFSPAPPYPVLYDATATIAERLSQGSTHAGLLYTADPVNGIQGVYSDPPSTKLTVVTRTSPGIANHLGADIKINGYSYFDLGWEITNRSGTGLNIESIQVTLPTSSSPYFDTDVRDFYTFGSLASTTGLLTPTNDANWTDSDVANGAKSFTMTFNDFAPGESFLFMIGVHSDASGGIWYNGGQLAGTQFTVNFSGNNALSGQASYLSTTVSQLTLSGTATALVPEPSTLVPAISGGLGLLFVVRRRRRP
jgi:hypothetical protein